MLPLLHEGSVKNIYGVKGESPYVFEFSNRYSVFDWGEMPDELTHKGKALSYIAWKLFMVLGDAKHWNNWGDEYLESELGDVLRQLRTSGVKNHCVETQNTEFSDQLKVEPVAVEKPLFENGIWNYDIYQNKLTNTLVPLEFIFRFGLPQGSSLMKRAQNKEYMAELGLAGELEFGMKFDVPVIEFSTKLEPKDRYVSYAEAKEMAGLSGQEFENLTNILKLLALRLKDIFADINIELWDGKFEMAFGDKANGVRDFILVDSIGPDELRLTSDGISLSKENLRNYYRDSDWHKGIAKAQAEAKKRKVSDWKSICTDEYKLVPAPMGDEYKNYASAIYTSLTNMLATHFGDPLVFSNTYSFQEVISYFREKMA